MDMKKRNGFISLLKFLLISCIVVYHYGIVTVSDGWFFLKGAAILTDFFFIVSGFYLATSAFKETTDHLGEKAWKFIFHKVKRMYPYILIGYILCFIVIIPYRDYNTPQIVNTFWELLLLKTSGIVTTNINGPAWYVSAMLLSMMILYPLFVKYQEKFIYLISPVIVIFGIGYLSQLPTTFGTWDYWNGYFMKGFLRAFVELNLGAIFYILVGKLNQIEFTKTGKGLLSFVCFMCFAVVLFVTGFINGTIQYNLFLLFLISMGTLLALSNKTVFPDVFHHRIFGFLEKISLPLFLTHNAFRFLFAYFNILSGLNYYLIISVYYAIALCVSILVYLFVEFLRKKELIARLKKIIVA